MGAADASHQAGFQQNIEGADTAQGRKVTVSGWAEAGASGKLFNVSIWQKFDSSTPDILVGSKTLHFEQLFAPFSTSFDIPLAGDKMNTAGANNCLQVRFIVSAGTGIGPTLDNMPTKK